MDLGIQILRILCATVEEKSFSGAARKLKITQPTVSQQIARLESEIDGKIFNRAGKEIELTLIGEKLYRTAKDIVIKADQLKTELSDSKNKYCGVVSYAMPESCQWTPTYKKIMSMLPEYPNVQFKIDICSNKLIYEKVKKSQVDFAFITGQIPDPNYIVEKFADEHYSLVARSPEQFSCLDQKKFQDFKLIGYTGYESFAITWTDQYKLLFQLKDLITEPAVMIGTMAGAIHSAIEGAGLLIIPTHCVLDELKDKKLYAYRPELGVNATQPIYLIKNPELSLSKQSHEMMEILTQIKKSIN